MKRTVKNIVYYLKTIWAKSRIYFLHLFLLVLAMALAPLLSAFLPKAFIQDILLRNTGKFMVDFTLLALLSCFSAFAVSYYTVKNSDIFVGLGFKLKEAIQEKTMKMPFADTENPKVLDQVNGALSSVDRFVGSVHEKGSLVLSNGVILVIFIVLICRLQPLLLLFLLLNVAVNVWMQNRAKAYQYQQKGEVSQLNRKKDYAFSLMYDYGYGKEIRLYSIQGWILSIYRHYQKQCQLLNLRISQKQFLASAADVVLTLLREILVYICLVWMFLKGSLSVDNLVLYLGIFASFAAAGQSFVSSATDLADAARNIEEYRNFVEADREPKDAPVAAVPEITAYSIEFQDVSFRYPKSEKYVLRHFSCLFEAGKHIAVVGLNGAGKSTFIKLLCGLYDDYEGEIRIGGVDMKKLDRRTHQSFISAVFQESKVLSATVLENITLSEENSDVAVQKAVAALKLCGLYDRVMQLPLQLDTPVTKVIDDRGVELSGGERQKLVIARAIYQDGKILVLDEPTAALDAIAENEIYEHFHTISQGKTTVFISHRLNSTRFCDEILLLADGKIQERGTHEALMEQQGTYCRLFQTQAKYYHEDKGENDA